jgi:hypothetical protein
VKNIPLMKCGHSANAEDKDGRPCCLICAELYESKVIATETPDLTGRTAKCSYSDCPKRKPSDLGLAFFEHRPKSTEDSFYCGCKGWD